MLVAGIFLIIIGAAMLLWQLVMREPLSDAALYHKITLKALGTIAAVLGVVLAALSFA